MYLTTGSILKKLFSAYIVSLSLFTLCNPSLVLPVSLYLSLCVLIILALKTYIFNKKNSLRFNIHLFLLKGFIFLAVATFIVLTNSKTTYLIGFVAAIFFFAFVPYLTIDLIANRSCFHNHLIGPIKYAFWIAVVSAITEHLLIKITDYDQLRLILQPVIGGAPPVGTRAQGFLIEPFYLSVLFTSAYLFIILHERIPSVFYVLGGLALRAGLIATGSAVSIWFVVLTYSVIFKSDRRRLVSFFIAVDLLLILAGVSFEQVSYTLENFLNKLFISDQSASDRFSAAEGFLLHMENASLNEIILGNGLGASSSHEMTTYSTLLNVWYDFGLVGLLFFLVAASAAFVRSTLSANVFIMPVFTQLLFTSVFWLPSNLFFLALWFWMSRRRYWTK